jgi:hypothetical protein
VEVVANVVPSGSEQLVLTGVHVGRNYLTLPSKTAADQTVSFDLKAWVFAAGKDQPVGRIDKTVSYDLKDESVRQKLRAEGFVYVPPPSKLPAGVYQIRVAVREKATGQMGTSYQFFEVVDVKNKKQMALSSLVLTAKGQTGFNGKNSFKGGTEVEMRYVIYNLPKEAEGLVQQVKLIDGQNKVLMDSPLAIARQVAGAEAGQFPQATMLNVPQMRGRYALIVSVRDQKRKVEIERRADFSVE